MVSKDTVFGLVGALVLVAAMGAVFYYEAGNVPVDTAGAVGQGTSTFLVDWNLTNTSKPPLDAATLAVTESRSHALLVPALATNVTITLAWTDNDARPAQLRSGPDTFRVEVRDADGNAVLGPIEGESGTLVLEWANESVQSPAEPRRVRGNDTADALRNLQAALGPPMQWTIVVTLVTTEEDAAGQVPPLGQQDPLDRDNDYRLETVVVAYEPLLTPA